LLWFSLTSLCPLSPRGRGGAIPPPPPPGRGVLTPRGTTVTRGALPVPPVARGVPTPRARGTPTVPGYRAPPPPAHEAYEEYVSTLRKWGVVQTVEELSLRDTHPPSTQEVICCRKPRSLKQNVTLHKKCSHFTGAIIVISVKHLKTWGGGSVPVGAGRRWGKEVNMVQTVYTCMSMEK
jgi:hypothetical protein